VNPYQLGSKDFFFEISAYPSKGGLSVFVKDITKRKRAERVVEERRLYLEGVLGAAPDAIVTLDAHHRIVEWNTGAERLFGYSREEASGQNIDDLVTDSDVIEEAIGFTQTVMGGGKIPPTETVRYRKDGSPVDVIVAGSPILVGDELIGAVAVYTDITERVRMEEALLALSLIDDLTSLYNRRGFLILAEQQLKTAKRAKRRMMLLFADLDGLKQINDTFGHSEGDRALIEVADVLTETFRESDVVARIGGDEFVVLAIETNGAPAEVLTARLQEKLEARNAREGRPYELSLSMGLARYDPERPCSIDDLLARADRVMYGQKRNNQKPWLKEAGSLWEVHE
jgi:diguanylate cyclase (GGDEF)-like protein/PAS domain S-box-containing protein